MRPRRNHGVQIQILPFGNDRHEPIPMAGSMPFTIGERGSVECSESVGADLSAAFASDVDCEWCGFSGVG